MKSDNKKVVAGAGVAGTLYIEETLLWLIDRAMDITLAYKDSIMLIFSTL